MIPPALRLLPARLLFTLWTLWLVIPAACPAQIPAFPGAAGFGSTTPGGSGRHLKPAKTSLIRVTTLKNAGPGSLRACIEYPAPRVCVFEIAGEIMLAAPLQIRRPYITVSGQTAPEPGITVSGAGIEIHTHDVVVQHLAVRPGDRIPGPAPENRDGVSVRGKSFNVLLDHLSVSWALDENISTSQEGVYDDTFSHSIIAEGLDRSIHP